MPVPTNNLTKENYFTASIEELESFLKANLKPLDYISTQKLKKGLPHAANADYPAALENYRKELLDLVAKNPNLRDKSYAEVQAIKGRIISQQETVKKNNHLLNVVRNEKARLDEIVKAESVTFLDTLSKNSEKIEELLKQVTPGAPANNQSNESATNNKNALLAAIADGIRLKKVVPQEKSTVAENATKNLSTEALGVVLKKQTYQDTRSDLEKATILFEKQTKANDATQIILTKTIKTLHDNNLELATWQNAAFKQSVQQQIEQQAALIKELEAEVKELAELKQEIQNKTTQLAKITAETQQNNANLELLKTPVMLEAAEDVPPAPPAPPVPSAPPAPPAPPTSFLSKNTSAKNATKSLVESSDIKDSTTTSTAKAPEGNLAFLEQLKARNEQSRLQNHNQQREEAEEKQRQERIVALEAQQAKEKQEKMARERAEAQATITQLNEKFGIVAITPIEITAKANAFSAKEQEKLTLQKTKFTANAHTKALALKKKLVDLEQQLTLAIAERDVSAANLAQATEQTATQQEPGTLAIAVGPIQLNHAMLLENTSNNVPEPHHQSQNTVETIFKALANIADIFQKGLDTQILELSNQKPATDSKAYKQLKTLQKSKIQMDSLINRYKNTEKNSATLRSFGSNLQHIIEENTEKPLKKLGYPGAFSNFMASVKNMITRIVNAIVKSERKVAHRLTEESLNSALQFSNTKEEITQHLTEQLANSTKNNHWPSNKNL